MDSHIERLPASDFAVAKNIPYVDVFGLHPLFDKVAFRSNLILTGPKGIAKSLSVAAWAGKNGHPLVTADCSEDHRRSNLVGLHVIRGDTTPFVLGPITTAFEVANEVGSCVLDLEEVNSLSPQAQKLLNPVADWRRKLEVPEAGKVFRLNAKAKLWLVGTMNSSVYGGVYALNEDLKSRFRMLSLPYPPTKEEKRIISETVQHGLEDDLVNGILLLAHETRQKALEYALSTRDVVQIIEDADAAGIEVALKLALGKFEGDDRNTVKERITSIFGIEIEAEAKPSGKAKTGTDPF